MKARGFAYASFSLVLLLTALLAAGCLQNGGSTPNPSVSADNSKITYTVTATDFSFNPSQLSASPGQVVTVVLKNRGSVVHTFTIPDLGINTGPVQPGSDKIVSFTAPMQAGAHQFLCTQPGHADRGMSGTITIG